MPYSFNLIGYGHDDHCALDLRVPFVEFQLRFGEILNIDVPKGRPAGAASIRANFGPDPSRPGRLGA